MGGLGTTIQERFEWQRQQEWLAAGVSERDIDFALKTGINAQDVQVFREFSAEGYLIVMRCPKRNALPWHGFFPPKHGALSKPEHKTGDSGVLVTKAGGDARQQIIVVSDYDLMCVWRDGPRGLEKIVVTAPNGAKRGPFSPDAKLVVRRLNSRLTARIQHGCNDDWDSPDNQGVDVDKPFAAFHRGVPSYLANATACEKYYTDAGIPWPYDGGGKRKRA